MQTHKYIVNKISNRIIYLFDEKYRNKINQRWIHWKEKNKEHRKEYWIKRREKNKEKIKINNHNKWVKRRVLEKEKNDWTINKTSIKKLLIQQNYLCVECWIDINNNYTLDHCKSLHDWWAHSITNIQLMCNSCNCKKHTKSYRVVNWDKIYL